LDGFLISLKAETGKPVPGFGEEGMVNLRVGVADKFPNRRYRMQSPPTIYKDLVITGSSVGEFSGAERGRRCAGLGDADRETGWDVSYDSEAGRAESRCVAGRDWVDRSGANAWGFIAVDVERGMGFVPVGTPNTDFCGGDRKGSNL
jgi:quinoprotein glucose dehydrogenase